MVYDRKLNYIRQQNGLDKIRQLTITNHGDETVRDVKLKLSFVPEFAESWVRYIGEIRVGEPLVINEPDLIMNPELLLSFNETVEGSIVAEILTADEKSDPVCKQAFEVTVLPYDLWLSNDHPELLAAFVTPNDRRVLEIVAKAGERLGIAFSGYRHGSADKQEVLKQMKVIYEVIQEEKITYCYPPANWDRGQRVRMPGFTLANKLGCCIDMAVLYASCLEAASLNPMVMILKGHAIAGCWLKQANFQETIVDDRETVEVRSYNKLGELAMVECTLMDNYAHNTSFEYAVNCTDKNFANFEYVVDVTRARSGGIRPMPLKEIHDDFSEDGGGLPLPDGDGESDAFYEDDDLDVLPDTTDDGLSKTEYWERKILDLSLSNALISMTFGRNTLPLVAGPDMIRYVTGELQEGRSFRILAAPSELEHIPDSRDMDGQNQCIRSLQALTEGDARSGRLRLLLGEKETLLKLKTVYRNAHTFMEESGANVLYLAAGLLKWRQKPNEKARYAPLVLIPVNLERKTANTDYTLSLREDEWQMNITLFEMLKQKFGIEIKNVETVPVIDGEVAYKALFKSVRKAISLKEGWDVVERAYVGIFSFGQFMMWKDLHDHAEEFAAQPIVASLINGHLTWEPKGAFLTQDELDCRLKPSDLVTPVSADGSQMVAIQAAAEGQSFVMHGPPGTGKSQTITNMIANALYQGKTVLFLAKKMPALEVVQKRLEEIGLGPFCLELHANKASKRHVLSQFEETMKLAGQAHDPLYDRTSKKLMEKRMDIRSMIELLHQPTKCGKSLYELMGILEEYHDAPDSAVFDVPSAMLVTKEELADWRRKLALLQETTAKLPDIANHPLKAIRRRGFKRQEKLKLRQQMQLWFTYYENLKSDIEDMQEKTGIEHCADVNMREYISLADVLAHAVIYPELMAKLFEDGEDMASIRAACKEIEKTQQVMAEVDAEYDREIMSANLCDAREGWRLAGGDSSKMGRLLRSGAARLLKKYAHDPESITTESVETRLDRLIVLQKAYEQTENHSKLVKRLLKAGKDVDWTLWEKADRRMNQVMDRLDMLAIDEDAYVRLQEYIQEQALHPDEGFREDRKQFAAIRNEYAALKQCTSEIIDMAGYELDTDSQNTSDLLFGEEWPQMLQSWQMHFQDIDAWCSYRQQSEQAEEAGLGPVVAAIENGLAPEDIFPAFYKGWAGTYVRRMIEMNQQLQYFNGLSYDRMIEEYKMLCQEFEEMSRQEIRARLMDRLPDKNEGSSSKSLSILNKAIMGGGSKLTVRQLFAKMPEAVRILAPCMLMSPASVAQFIDPDFPKFDLIIIDEASQMPTCEAVGALARGKSVVIAGDEQQLPPTNFFKKKPAGDNIELDDLESILDDTLALNMPQCYLNWHYRSAHESLIAFSNAIYYDHGLRTFPSIDNQQSAVSFVNVNGIYDRAGTRTNETEANAVVEEMHRRLLEDNTRSIGVITFNISQCGLIEDKWANMLESDEELAAAVRDMETPVFIKNLENIQGDERDVILFSLGYGPDEEGKMSMNFGPVNQNGGHRRLNVAVTRARREMVVFASFEPEAIQTTPRSVQGLKDLKTFMTYAKHGLSVLDYDERVLTEERTTVNRQIADRLSEKGYQADINIGTSDFRIDVAVRNPDRPEEYLLGIIFDDDAKALKDTVKDRTILQKEVLDRMGWKILNLWLMDWWEDQETQIQRIEAAIAN